MNELALNQIFTQIGLRKIAYFCSSTLGNDLYFLKEFIEVMINVIGEEKLITMLKDDISSNSKVNKQIGENWFKSNGMKKKLIELDRIIEQTKCAYDLLEDKTLKDTKKPSYKNFIKKCKKVPMIKPELYSLFVFLVNSSSIKRMSINPEYFKVLESRQFKMAGEFDKKRVGDQSKPKQVIKE